MWKDFVGKDFDRDGFVDYIARLPMAAFTWKPKGVTLHNTAAPTLAQWAESGPNHDARIRNLQDYYENRLGWHAGPHAFISRTKITVFSGLTSSGIHSRCFNSTHIGLEMAGDFEKEEFDSGDGALVRDNAVFAIAALCKRFGFDPRSDLTFHRECKQDNHACPGSKVRKPDIIQRVLGLMVGNKLKQQVAQTISEIDILALQSKLKQSGFDPGPLDGDRGPKTNEALQDFAIHRLTQGN